MMKTIKYILFPIFFFLCFNLSAQSDSTIVVLDTTSYPSARFEKYNNTLLDTNKHVKLQKGFKKELCRNAKGEVVMPIERVVIKNDNLEKDLIKLER